MTIEEIEELRKHIKILQQTILEVRHAQYNVSDWYTRGDSGLYQQVSMWLEKGQVSIDYCNEILKAK